jgi:hypothetical protein
LVISDAVTDPQGLAKRRRQTDPARRAFDQKFPTREARSAHFRAIAQRAHDRRLTLPGDDVEKLRRALALLTLPGDDAENQHRAVTLLRSSPKLNDRDLDDVDQDGMHEARTGTERAVPPGNEGAPIESPHAHGASVSGAAVVMRDEG